MKFPDDEVSAMLAEVSTAVYESEQKHGPQMNLPLGCSRFFGIAAENAKERTDAASKRGDVTWMDIAMEEALECFAEEDLAKIRAEALQAAAMFVQIARVCDYQHARAEAV